MFPVVVNSVVLVVCCLGYKKRVVDSLGCCGLMSFMQDPTGMHLTLTTPTIKTETNTDLGLFVELRPRAPQPLASKVKPFSAVITVDGIPFDRHNPWYSARPHHRPPVLLRRRPRHPSRLRNSDGVTQQRAFFETPPPPTTKSKRRVHCWLTASFPPLKAFLPLHHVLRLLLVQRLQASGRQAPANTAERRLCQLRRDGETSARCCCCTVYRTSICRALLDA